MKQKGSILAIDRGKKYIGCAYALESSTVVFPIGYIMNDKTALSSISELTTRYRVKKIVIGIPHDERAKGQIEHFAQGVAKVVDREVEIELFDEDYTSVQAGDKIGNFKKNIAEDTLAAMVILERRIAAQTSESA